MTVAALVAAAILLPGCGLRACISISDHKLTVAAPGGTAEPGEQITFTASWTFDDIKVDAHEDSGFDLDGDGIFETSSIGEDSATATRSYGTPQTVTVSHYLHAVRPADSKGEKEDTSVASEVLTIGSPAATEQPPLASVVVTPNPAGVGEYVVIDASGSRDADGSIVRYEFDVDGNGSFEFDNGGNPQLNTSFAPAGNYPVRLRVTDDDGLTGEAGTTVVVQQAGAAIEPSDGFAGAGPPSTIELDLRGHRTHDGFTALNGDQLLTVGNQARGRFPAAEIPQQLHRRDLKVRWASRFTTVLDIADNSTTGFGVILLAYPAGGKSCLGFEFDGPADARPSGRFEVIGGSGRARDLHGHGEGKIDLDGDGAVMLTGSGELTDGKPFTRLGKNGCPSLRGEVRRRPENSRVG